MKEYKCRSYACALSVSTADNDKSCKVNKWYSQTTYFFEFMKFITTISSKVKLKHKLKSRMVDIPNCKLDRDVLHQFTGTSCIMEKAMYSHLFLLE